jgi:RND family efflux transporter MFP subunit
MKDAVLWLIGGLAACAVAMAGCAREKGYEKPLKPVRVVAAKPYAGGRGMRYSAAINPYSQVNMSFKVNGYVRAILRKQGADGRMRDVQEGDRVNANTVLAWVQESSYVDKVNQAKAQLAGNLAALNKARLDFARAESLYATKSLTKPDYDAAVEELSVAEAQVDASKAQLKEARTNLGYCELKAPMAGVILSRNIEVGSLATPGTVGFVLSNTSSVKAVFGVPGSMLNTLKLGKPLGIRTESVPNTEFRGRITAISPAANSKSRVFEVEITIPNAHGQLKPGMIGALEVGGAEAPESIVVPLSAVVRSPSDPAGYAVFIVEGTGDNRVARIRNVKLGGVLGNMIAVDDGLTAGERVIMSGATMVVNGEKVRVIP